MKKEVLRPIIWVTIIVLAVILWQIRGRFTHEQNYLAYYNNIQGLQPSSQVFVNGVRVGKISNIDLNGKGRVKVTITVKKDFPLPEGTVAYLASGGLTGDKVILLKPGKSNNILPDGATLFTAYDTSVMEVSERITPMIETAKIILKNSDSSLSAFSDLISSGILTSTTRRLITIERNSRGFARAAASLNRKGANITNAIDNVDSITRHAAAGNDQRTKSLRDNAKKMEDLSKTTLPEQIKNIQKSVATIKAAVNKANSNSLISDKQAYQKFNQQIDTLHQGLNQFYKGDQPQ